MNGTQQPRRSKSVPRSRKSFAEKLEEDIALTLVAKDIAESQQQQQSCTAAHNAALAKKQRMAQMMDSCSHRGLERRSTFTAATAQASPKKKKMIKVHAKDLDLINSSQSSLDCGGSNMIKIRAKDLATLGQLSPSELAQHLKNKRLEQQQQQTGGGNGGGDHVAVNGSSRSATDSTIRTRSRSKSRLRAGRDDEHGNRRDENAPVEEAETASSTTDTTSANYRRSRSLTRRGTLKKRDSGDGGGEAATAAEGKCMDMQRSRGRSKSRGRLFRRSTNDGDADGASAVDAGGLVEKVKQYRRSKSARRHSEESCDSASVSSAGRGKQWLRRLSFKGNDGGAESDAASVSSTKERKRSFSIGRRRKSNSDKVDASGSGSGSGDKTERGFRLRRGSFKKEDSTTSASDESTFSASSPTRNVAPRLPQRVPSIDDSRINNNGSSRSNLRVACPTY